MNIYLIFLVVDANWGYSLGITAISPVLRAASITAIGAILVLQIIKTKALKLDFLVCVFLCYLVFGAVVGLIKNGPSYEFFRHLFAASTMLIAYWAGRFLIFEGVHIDKTLRIWARVSVAGGALAWVMAYKMILVSAFSMSPVSQFLPLSVGLTIGGFGLVALPVLMIAFGNKRDVILGAAAIFAVVFIRRYLANMNTGLRIFAGVVFSIIFALLIFLVVAQSHQFIAKLGFANLAERSNRVMDFVGEEVRRDEELAANENDGSNESAGPKESANLKGGANYDENVAPLISEATYWRLEKLTSSRLSLAASVFTSVSESKLGLLLGKGFGGSYTWKYWSDNMEGWQEYVMYQSDLMPFWFFLTSGSVLAILLLGGIFCKLMDIFIYSTRNTVDIAALLVIGSSFGMLLSFQPNVPLFWLFLGSMSARIQSRKTS